MPIQFQYVRSSEGWSNPSETNCVNLDMTSNEQSIASCGMVELSQARRTSFRCRSGVNLRGKQMPIGSLGENGQYRATLQTLR